MKLAILFPGQGSQEVGMASDFYAEFETVKEVFQEADSALGFALSDIIQTGPSDTLTLTENAQPAILTASYAVWTLVREFLENASVCSFAGHSLGEYTALSSAGALSFADAVRLVHLRGKFMQSAVPVGEGMMIAVLGLPIEKVQGVIDALELQDEVVDIANVNAPDQLVVSGERAGVEKCVEPLKSAGAKRVIELKVSAPFHSRLMKPCAESLAPYLRETPFRAPSAPVFSNVTASVYPKETGRFADMLIEQITSPVRWVEEVSAISALCPDLFVELGPGKVLRNLVPRILPGAKSTGVSNVEEFKAFLAVLAGEVTI